MTEMTGRLLFFSPSFCSLTETFLYHQLDGLQNWHRTLVTYRRENQDVYPENGWTEHIISPYGSLKHRALGRLRRLLNGNAYLWDWSTESAFFSLVSETAPNVILAEYGLAGLACCEAAKRAGVPLVVYFLGYDLSRLFRIPKYRKSLKNLIPLASALVVTNSIQKKRLLSLNCPEYKIHVIPCGAKIDIPVPVGEIERESDIRFLHVGRLVEKKGILVTIEAFAQALKPDLPIKLTIVGDGPLRPHCESLVDKLGIRTAVEFLGTITHSELLQILPRSDIFLLHSLTAPDGDEEGMPVALSEAMAVGLPIASTIHPGIADHVIDEVEGLLVPEGDVPSFALAIDRLARDSKLREKLGAAARQKGSQILDLETWLNKLDRVLRQCHQNPQTSE